MIETLDFPSLSCLKNFYIRITPIIPVCWLLILCYQLVQNGTGGIGTDKSCFRFIGCLEVQSCLRTVLFFVYLVYCFNFETGNQCLQYCIKISALLRLTSLI
jgi:hypothetical protein